MWQPRETGPSDPAYQEQLPCDFILKGQEAVVSPVTCNHDFSTDRLLQRYSSLSNLVKTTAWLLRYKQCFIDRVRKPNKFKTFSHYLSADELKYAEVKLIKYVQSQHFASSLKTCCSKNPVLSGNVCSRPMKKLRPVVVDEIFRVGGRLERAPVKYGNKHPSILSNNSHLTNLLFTDSILKLVTPAWDICGLHCDSTAGLSK